MNRINENNRENKKQVVREKDRRVNEEKGNCLINEKIKYKLIEDSLFVIFPLVVFSCY